jgi:hypothetical protein
MGTEVTDKEIYKNPNVCVVRIVCGFLHKTCGRNNGNGDGA